MGQSITTDLAQPVPRDLVVTLSCPYGCTQVGHFDVYVGGDFIEMRGRIHADGWRQRGGQWFKNECVPKGKDDDG